ncbi:MAG: c-type cytochrome, partial [Gemmataceae bacterium]|nr:c-type cytochrome [Gemmataceae bacterium]
MRVDPQLAFHWGEALPDPRLAEREFRATWQGHLYVLTRGDYRFFLFGSGEVELKIAGQEVVARQILRNGWCTSPPVPLAAEFLPFALSFRRTDKDAHLMVLWSGPDFGPEPIPPRFLFHPREQSVENTFDRGQLLSRVLRCGQCHSEEPRPQPAPALDRLGGNLSRDWLVRWLIAGEHARPDQADRQKQAEPLSPRRMPAFGLSRSQAEAVADWLLKGGPGLPPAASANLAANVPSQPEKPSQPQRGRRQSLPKVQPHAKMGEELFLTVGCLACHSWRDLGASGWLGGGDLTHIAEKRPPRFFADWLADPARLNRDHRMPVFALSDVERTSLALFLAEQEPAGAKPASGTHDTEERRAEGRKLIEQFRCGSCHRLPETTNGQPAPFVPQLSERSHWDQSCLGAPDVAKHRPGYHLGEKDAHAVRLYYTSRRPTVVGQPAPLDGRLLLAEHNCLACHAREGTRESIPLLPPLLPDKLAAVAQRYPDLATLVPALTPPALNSVGDKLTDQALADAITRRGPPHRPYLRASMPRFPLRDDELQALVQYLIHTDRVPPRDTGTPRPVAPAQQDHYVLAGGRLLSSDGFGCTSCHQIGSVLPSQAPLNARGPDLAQPQRRLRQAWFDRWLRNPARIVPRMEMPSVQIPVSGVLNEKLDDQIAAVWHVLNLPKFEPPPPNPIRTLRHDGQDRSAPPVLVTDVLQHGGQTLIKPFLVGLANRHQVLLDLEAARLAQWTVGDVARQQTKGKTWFWELGGATVLSTGITGPDLSLVVGGQEISPQPLGQFMTEADGWQIEGTGLTLYYRLVFGQKKTETLQVRRKLGLLAPSSPDLATGFVQELSAGPLPAGSSLRLAVLSPQTSMKATLSADGRAIHLRDRFASQIILQEPAGARFAPDATQVRLVPDEKGFAHAVLHYQSEIPIDRFPQLPPSTDAIRDGTPVEVAPGVVGERLPLPALIMPSALAWRPDGRLVLSSLKGQVFDALDTNHDGRADRLVLLADGLPTPYGLHAGPGYVDVSAKYAVLRIWDTASSPLT